MGGGPPSFPQGSTCPAVLRILLACPMISPTGLSPPLAGFPKTVRLSRHTRLMQSLPRRARRAGLGSSPFARRYLGNRCFFLFLRVLRCFSSPGSPRIPMDSIYGGRSPSCRVSPCRNLRVIEYLLLTAAYRSLSRLSSALSAKASTLCSFLLDLTSFPAGAGTRFLRT